MGVLSKGVNEMNAVVRIGFGVQCIWRYGFADMFVGEYAIRISAREGK